ncbi:MAG TPA: hypothetical protein VKR06_32905, partial [Ktedonosporobacter sp.]|nr:hypothetical protein [Ktedonosporobacter sp.]
MASVLAAARRGASSSSLSAEDQQQEIKKFTSLVGPLGEGSNALGNALPFIPPLYVVLRWVEEHWLQDLAQNITRGAIWKWYKKELKLPEDTPIKTVLQVLSDTTNPSQKNRQILIDLLIAAFFEDLRDAMNKPNPVSLNKFDLGEAYAWLLNRELLLSDQLR